MVAPRSAMNCCMNAAIRSWSMWCGSPGMAPSFRRGTHSIEGARGASRIGADYVGRYRGLRISVPDSRGQSSALAAGETIPAMVRSILEREQELAELGAAAR